MVNAQVIKGSIYDLNDLKFDDLKFEMEKELDGTPDFDLQNYFNVTINGEI